MNCVRHGSSATFETKSSYCIARLGFKRRVTAALKCNSINLVRLGSSTAFETGLTYELMAEIE